MTRSSDALRRHRTRQPTQLCTRRAGAQRQSGKGKRGSLSGRSVDRQDPLRKIVRLFLLSHSGTPGTPGSPPDCPRPSHTQRPTPKRTALRPPTSRSLAASPPSRAAMPTSPTDTPSSCPCSPTALNCTKTPRPVSIARNQPPFPSGRSVSTSAPSSYLSLLSNTPPRGHVCPPRTLAPAQNSPFGISCPRMDRFGQDSLADSGA